MAATAIAYWLGITDQQLESQPPFYNSGYSWAEWLAALQEEPSATQSLTSLGAGALLTAMTDGMSDEEVLWVAPRELRAATERLRSAIEDNHPDTQPILDLYRRHRTEARSVVEEFLAVLTELEDLILWAEGEGAMRMTIEVNW